MTVESKSTATVHLQKSKKNEPESPSVVSRVKDYIGIAVGIVNIIKFFKDILTP